MDGKTHSGDIKGGLKFQEPEKAVKIYPAAMVKARERMLWCVDKYV